MKKPIESAEVQNENKKNIAQQSNETSNQFTDEEQRKMQQEMQKHFWKFKRKFKTKSKGELIAIIWEQGMEFKKLQDIAAELYEENRALKEAGNEKNSKEDK